MGHASSPTRSRSRSAPAWRATPCCLGPAGHRKDVPGRLLRQGCKSRARRSAPRRTWNWGRRRQVPGLRGAERRRKFLLLVDFRQLPCWTLAHQRAGASSFATWPADTAAPRSPGAPCAPDALRLRAKEGAFESAALPYKLETVARRSTEETRPLLGSRMEERPKQRRWNGVTTL